MSGEQAMMNALYRMSGFAAAGFAALSATACVVEQIDAVIAEHGVTFWASSTSEGSGGSGESTSTGTHDDTGAAEAGSSEASTTAAASVSTSTGAEDSSGGSGDSGSSSGTTGPADPVCGDGVTQLDETCDDGNEILGDGCQMCAQDLIIFISSEIYQGFKLGGLYGADQHCRGLAAKAGLPRPEAFIAWLSDSTMAAADRIEHSPGRYLLVNGNLVANGWAELTSGAIANTITIDEYKEIQDTRAWTGTLASGQRAPGSDFCEDWEQPGLLKSGGTGLSVSTEDTWSFFKPGPCDSELHLYCVQQ